MTRITAIARRELGSYFYSPIAYVAMFLFLIAAAFAFWNDFMPGQPAAMRSLFDWMVWFLVFIVPVLTMGLLAQEWASGTIETMMTAPVNETDMVLGKFLGSLAFFGVLLSPTILYVAILCLFARPEFGPIVSGYVGLLLVGSLFIAVGLFCSSLTRSQVVAAVAAAAILLVGSIVPYEAASKGALPAFIRKLVDQSVLLRYADFSKGIIDLGNVVFFAAFTGVLLFLTAKVLESRRWQ